MEQKLLFFGCGNRQKGHYLAATDDGLSVRNEDAVRFFGSEKEGFVFKYIDGTFTPCDTREQGLYQVNSVPPLTIVSWWDYTGDSRRNSNSNLIGTGFTSAEEMIDAAVKKFPRTMSRQPRPIPNPTQK